MVITSSESASSIDTQFAAMTSEISKSVEAVTIGLDEKKCATMKATIALIQMKLRTQFNQHMPDYPQTQAEEIKNHRWECEAAPSSGSGSSKDGDSDEEKYEEIPPNALYFPRESDQNYVSTLQNPSFCVESTYRPSVQPSN